MKLIARESLVTCVTSALGFAKGKGKADNSQPKARSSKWSEEDAQWASNVDFIGKKSLKTTMTTLVVELYILYHIIWLNYTCIIQYNTYNFRPAVPV